MLSERRSSAGTRKAAQARYRSIVVADLGIPKGSGCTNSVDGQAVIYPPDDGLVGKDRFTYRVPADPTAFVYLGPPPRPWTVFVLVR